MNREMNAVYATVVAALFGFAALNAPANEPPTDDGTGASELDLRNRQARAHFDRLDSNRDGQITQAELDADDQNYLDSDARGYRIDLASLDANSDGVISRQEWNDKYYDLHGTRYDERFRSGAWDGAIDRNPPSR